MTTGGKSIELIVDHLRCGLGPCLNLAAGPELYLRNVVVSSDVAVVWNRSRTAEFGVHGVHEYGGC